MSKLIEILSQPKYLLLVLAISLGIVAFAAWLPNLHLVTKTMTSSTMSLWQKTNLLTSLLGSLRTNFTQFSLVVTFTSALLTGTQISLLVYYLRQTAQIQQSMGVSALGIVSSMFGVGCASCGSVILTSVVGLSASTTALGVLPLKGQEFGLVGVGVLLIAIHLTVKKINQPWACEIKIK